MKLWLGVTAVFVSAMFGGHWVARAGEVNHYTLSSIEANFAGEAIGRVYASDGENYFAIGGKDKSGQFSKGVQILARTSKDKYELHHAELSEPIAFAGTVGSGGSVYLVGGLNEQGVGRRVIELKWEGNRLQEKALPDLPEPRALAGVTIHQSTTKQYLYVLSGIDSPHAAVASPAMWELSLEKAKKGIASWTRKDDLPFGGRLGAVVRDTYNEIIVAGGWSLEADGRLVVTNSVWGYSRVARDGHPDAGWEKRADLPVSVAMPAYSKTGQAHLTVVGGDVAGGTLAELLAGTKPIMPIDAIWAFHDPTDTWTTLGKMPGPAVGGLFAAITSDTYLLVGTTTKNGDVHTAMEFTFLRTTKPMKPVDYAIIVLYFLAVAGIGAFFARKQAKQKEAEKFALGGRNMKWWVVAISAFAAGVSTISFMAIPALIACIGLGATGSILFMIPGICIGAYVTFPLLRRLKITSTYEYLEQRYGLLLRLLGSFVAIISMLMGRIGIVIMLPALAISSMTGIDPVISILLIGIFTTFYSSLGGFEAVVYTDMLQGIMMMVGFIVMCALAYLNIDGGFQTFLHYGQELHRLNFFITKFDITTNMMWFALISQLIGIMAFASDQGTAQRVLSTPMKDVRKLAFFGGAISIGVALIVAATGMGLFGFFKGHPELLSPVMKNDQLVPLFILNRIPVGLAGLLIATLFAAAMGASSSSMNSCSVLFAEDFYKRFSKKADSQKEMRVMQAFTVMSGLLGTGVAMWLLNLSMPTLMEAFIRITAMFGGGFVGVYALGMFTRRTHELGAFLGVIVSFIVGFLLQYLPWDIHYNGLGLIMVGSCIVSGYVLSLVIPWKRNPLSGLTIWDMISDEEAEARLAPGLKNDFKH